MSLNDQLKVAVLPINITEGDKAANMDCVAQSMAAMPQDTDLLVLPELFSTGYIYESEEAAELAEPTDGNTVSQIKQLANKYKVAIAGSFLSVSDGNLYNRGFIIEPGGEATFYDKRHLFCISAESQICKHGTKLPPVVRYRGWNIALVICYDLRFPAWLRNLGNKYDLLLVPANWPDRRSYAWTQLLSARAIENESYVVGANRSGEDKFGIYDGLSRVYDYEGQPIGQQEGDYLCATLNKVTEDNHRTHFPVWKDADNFKIDL